MTDTSPARDFVSIVWKQMTVMHGVATGTFPLHVSTAWGTLDGIFFAFTGLLYLPLSWIALVLPGYWTGSAVEWKVLLHFFTLAAAHGALFLFLRRAGITGGLSLLLSIITVYPQRTIIYWSTGMALEAWTGQLFLCSAVGLYYLKPTPVRGPLFIIAAAYWLLNSGHPGEIFYGLIGAGLFSLILPFFLKTVPLAVNVTTRSIPRFWFGVTACCTVGLVLSAASLLPFYFDVARKLAATHQGYSWAVFLQMTPFDLVNNFTFPLQVDSEKSFASSPLYLAALLVPFLIFLRVKIPLVILVIPGIILPALLYGLGDLTPVHGLVWKYIPFVDSIRRPPRAFSILSMQFLFLLIWMFHAPGMVRLRLLRRDFQLSTGSVPALVALFVFPVLLIAAGMMNSIFDHGFPVAMNYRLLPGWAEPSIVLTGVLLPAGIVLYGRPGSSKRAVTVLLCLILCFHLVILLKFAPPANFTSKDTFILPTLQEIKDQKQYNADMFLDNQYTDASGTFIYHDALRHLQAGHLLEPCLARIGRQYHYVSDREEAYEILNRERRIDTVVLENVPPAGRLNDPANSPRGGPDRVELVYNSFNRLVFQVRAGSSSFFVLSYPHSRHWKASVNDREAIIYRANGLAQAVAVPEGVSIIEFRYWSRAAFLGMVISCLSIGLVSVFFGFIAVRKPVSRVSALMGCLIGLALFVFWHQSLYSGDNLNTQYVWQADACPDEALPNIAYGRPTSVSSRLRHTFFDGFGAMFDGKQAVDGNNAITSACITEFEHMPWWEIDLEAERLVQSVKVHAKFQGHEFNRFVAGKIDSIAFGKIHGKPVAMKKPVLFNNLPLIIGFSSDQVHWEHRLVHEINSEEPLHLVFKEPKRFRYMAIMASGEGRLYLNEVEIFPWTGATVSP